MAEKEKVIAYYDASNFYHLAKENYGLKGFNFLSLTMALLKQNQELKLIKFFTAPVNQQEKPDDAKEQQRFFAHLEKEPLIKLHLGNLVSRSLKEIKIYCKNCRKELISKDVSCPKCGRLLNLNFSKRTVEKGVDVKIAMNLLIDAIRNEYDVALLLSSDADFVPVVDYIKNKLNKKVVYCHFPDPFTSDLVRASSSTFLIEKDLLLRNRA